MGLDLLRLNIQYFADNPDDDKGGDGKDDDKQRKDDEDKGGASGKDTGGEPGKKGGGEGADEKTVNMTQEEFDKIIADRLAREKKKRDEAIERERDEAERKRLEEDEKYKELADKLQKQLDDQKADALKVKKESMLAKAGYDEDQVGRYVKYLEGENDEELTAALDELKADIPPKKPYADPSANNGGKDMPGTKGSADKGKTMYQKLKEKGKIKR